MAETHSLAVTAVHSTKQGAPLSIGVPDSAGRAGHLNYWASRGQQILCLNPDGSQSYYTFDAERSTTNNLVMRKV